jgi:phage terminase large subunit-like protein
VGTEMTPSEKSVNYARDLVDGKEKGADWTVVRARRLLEDLEEDARALRNPLDPTVDPSMYVNVNVAFNPEVFDKICYAIERATEFELEPWRCFLLREILLFGTVPSDTDPGEAFQK